MGYKGIKRVQNGLISTGAVVFMVLAVLISLRCAEDRERNLNISEKNVSITTGQDVIPVSINVTAKYSDVPIPTELSRGEMLRGTSSTMTLTGYCPCEECCGKWAQFGRTASGLKPIAGRTVANGTLPFGTRVYIDGHIYTVEDRGVGWDCIDIFFDTHDEALLFGKNESEVLILFD